ncbi:FHA domain-containing protein [bacterium]|nr:FHA domain-containing protein [bacterium]
MRPKARFVLKDNPQIFYEIPQEEFLVGRSKECAIVLSDPAVSRLHARIHFENGRYFIENLGRNPTLVNGLPTKGQILREKDHIVLGTTELLFRVEEKNVDIPEGPLIEDRTVIATSRQIKPSGPMLVSTSSSSESSSYPITKERFLIGRAENADAVLKDPSISREHCVIVKRKEGYFARNLSQTNPLLINDEVISEKHIYTGDQLRIGPFSLSFISDRPEDVKPVEEKIISRARGPSLAVWVLGTFVLLCLAGYLFYEQAYRPWKVERALKSASEQIAARSYVSARNRLKGLLATGLPAEEAEKARKLLSQTTLGIIQTMIEKEKLEDAKRYLITYLKDYGIGKEADAIWERLDFLRLRLGRDSESRENYQAALREYAAIRQDSPWFNDAQKSIRRVWLADQQKRFEHQTKAQLIKDAERHFAAKRYLTPVNENAYSAYQAIIALDPENALAHQRIAQIKAFYREQGVNYFREKKWREALSYFERFSLIDPDDSDIRAKLDICRKNLVTPQPKVRKSERQEPASDRQKERVKRLLEESGVESTRIMKYLFEEEGGEKEQEKPW